MADYPVRIEVLSRFRKRAEIKKTLEDLKQGKVDIVIGTHRLIQKDVELKDIGLAIIDEEQRFGVKHKEYLKQLRKVIDVLTMTATPIPRTLYLSLVGARDMSNIDTPPLDRLPVKTILTEYDKAVIRTAIQRELNRQGQVFYLHNRVKTIDKVKDGLEKLVPHATIMTAHGQMAEGELETIMEHFVNGKIDVLVCTTIIESGLDIPNANTIIIDRADRFGLADLYQLRGRVGRWKHQAYAYLVVPKSRELLETAKKRLRAVLDAQGYGAGFQIAMHDLEIRGAGNILGVEQSGHINAIGFGLYCKLLKRTIERMKGLYVPEPMDVKIKLPIHALIPEDYIPDPAQRIDTYKRLADIVTEQELTSIRKELRDRYGPFPYETENLLNVVSLRLFAEEYSLTRVELDDDKIIAERSGKRIMTGTRFPRIKAAGDKTIVTEIKKKLKSLLE
jgi:transcription-repair coupling factor (superfamily II helicase)